MKKVILLSVLLLSVITLNAQKKRHIGELTNPVTTNPAQWAKVKTTQVSWEARIHDIKRNRLRSPVYKKSMKLTAWKGEKVSAQFVVWSTQDVNHLSFVISDLRSSKSKITATGNIQTGFVRYVMTDELNKDGKGGCGYRNKADFDSTLVADPIDHHTHILSIPARSTQAGWISIRIPQQTKEAQHGLPETLTSSTRKGVPPFALRG